MTEYMDTREAAELWGVTQATVCSWCRKGKLKLGAKPCEQDAPGSRWRIRKDAIPPRRR